MELQVTYKILINKLRNNFLRNKSNCTKNIEHDEENKKTMRVLVVFFKTFLQLFKLIIFFCVWSIMEKRNNMDIFCQFGMFNHFAIKIK